MIKSALEVIRATLKVIHNSSSMGNSKSVFLDDPRYPICGVGPTEKEARADLKEKRKKYEAHVVLGEIREEKFFCKIEPASLGFTGKDGLHVKIGANVSIAFQKSFFDKDDMLNFHLSEGFLVWEDYVVDNYVARSLLWSLVDHNLNTGGTVNEGYKLQIFNAITKLWD